MRGLMPTFSIVRRSQSIKAVVLLSCVMILAVLLGSAFLLFDLHNRELTHAKGEIASLSRILSEQTTRAFDGPSEIDVSGRSRRHGGQLIQKGFLISILRCAADFLQSFCSK